MTPKRLATILFILALVGLIYAQFLFGFYFGLAFFATMFVVFFVMYLAVCVAKGRWIGPKRIWAGFKEFVDFIWN